MNILIPIAKSSKKIKSSYHKSLIKLNKTTNLIQYQLQTLGKINTKMSINFIVDEFKDDIIEVCEGYKNNLPLNYSINYVESRNSTLSDSILDGFESINKKSCTLIMGDVIFNPSAIKIVSNKKVSTFLLDDKGFFARNEIGLWNQKNCIKHFCYSLPVKWAQIAYLESMFIENYKIYHSSNLLPHEIFNAIIDKSGCECKSVISKYSKVIEIDKPKDIRMAKQVFV